MEIGTLSRYGFHPIKAISQDSFLGGDLYGDKRLSHCLSRLRARAYACQSLVINQLTTNVVERESWYELLKHPKLELSKMLSELIDRSQSWAESDHLLLLQDSTILNYNKLKDRLANQGSLGPIDTPYKTLFGTYLHVSLAIDASLGFPVGISDAQFWHKSADISDYTQRKGEAIPIEKKSSYRWIDAAKSSNERIGHSIRKTVITDREADIYEAFCEWRDQGLDFIVRSQHDRNIVHPSKKLRTYLSEQAIKGKFEIHLQSNGLNQTVELGLRYGKVEIKRGHKAQSSGIGAYPETTEMYALWASTEPTAEQPISWILLTSHPIHSNEDALQIIHWYKERWHIEQFFRLLKNQGLQLEALKYKEGLSILRMAIIALETAFKVLQFDLGIKSEQPISINTFFSSEQRKLLKHLSDRVQGRTTKSKNPYQTDRLQWAIWVIARIGGWKGYNSQARPGPITILRGWKKFQEIFIGYNILNSEIENPES